MEQSKISTKQLSQKPLTISFINDQQPTVFPNINQLIIDQCKSYYIGNDQNANIRSFYMAYLKSIVRGTGKYGHKNKKQSLIYRNSTILTCVKQVPKLKIENKPRSSGLLTTFQMKKLLGEFFHLISQGFGDIKKLQQIFQKYSYIHILMTVLMRSLLWLQYDLSQAIIYNKKIDDRLIYTSLSSLLQVTDLRYEGEKTTILGYHLYAFEPKNNFSESESDKLYFLNQRVSEDENSSIRGRSKTQPFEQIQNNPQQKIQKQSLNSKLISMRKLQSFQEELSFCHQDNLQYQNWVNQLNNQRNKRSSIEETYQSEDTDRKN